MSDKLNQDPENITLEICKKPVDTSAPHLVIYNKEDFILAARTLSDVELFCWLSLCTDGPGTNSVVVDYERVADLAKCTVEDVAVAMDRLEELGYIVNGAFYQASQIN